MRSIRRIAIVVGFLLIAWCLISEILFDLVPVAKNYNDVKRLRSEIVIARAKWEAANITSYKFEVKGFIPLRCMYNEKITIRNNEIVDVLTRQDEFDDLSSFVPKPEKWDDNFCNYHQFTVAQIFADLDKELVNIDPSVKKLEITFDPNFGYVTSIESSIPVGNGLFSPKISDCCSWFTFSNFQLFDSPVP